MISSIEIQSQRQIRPTQQPNGIKALNCLPGKLRQGPGENRKPSRSANFHTPVNRAPTRRTPRRAPAGRGGGRSISTRQVRTARVRTASQQGGRLATARLRYVRSSQQVGDTYKCSRALEGCGFGLTLTDLKFVADLMSQPNRALRRVASAAPGKGCHFGTRLLGSSRRAFGSATARPPVPVIRSPVPRTAALRCPRVGRGAARRAVSGTHRGGAVTPRVLTQQWLASFGLDVLAGRGAYIRALSRLVRIILHRGRSPMLPIRDPNPARYVPGCRKLPKPGDDTARTPGAVGVLARRFACWHFKCALGTPQMA